MDRLTRPGVAVDQTAVRFMGTEVKIQDIGDKLLHLILNGPTINSINKDTLRHLVRQLYEALQRYEDTDLSPEQVLEMQGEMVTCYAPDGGPYLVEATGLQAKRIIDRDIAESQGRIWEAPCKMGTTLYMIVTKRPKLNWPEFSFVKTSYLTENNFFRVIRDFGKTVFLTKEEADAALEKLKEE